MFQETTKTIPFLDPIEIKDIKKASVSGKYPHDTTSVDNLYHNE